MADASPFEAAKSDLGLTPEEENLYQMHLDNLNDPKKRVVHPNGDVSTLYQAVEEHNGKYYNVPTVWNGKINKDSKDYLKEVEKQGWDKFPSYDTPEAADARYMQMHQYMDQDVGLFNEGRPKKSRTEKRYG